MTTASRPASATPTSSAGIFAERALGRAKAAGPVGSVGPASPPSASEGDGAFAVALDAQGPSPAAQWQAKRRAAADLAPPIAAESPTVVVVPASPLVPGFASDPGEPKVGGTEPVWGKDAHGEPSDSSDGQEELMPLACPVATVPGPVLVTVPRSADNPTARPGASPDALLALIEAKATEIERPSPSGKAPAVIGSGFDGVLQTGSASVLAGPALKDVAEPVVAAPIVPASASAAASPVTAPASAAASPVTAVRGRWVEFSQAGLEVPPDRTIVGAAVLAAPAGSVPASEAAAAPSSPSLPGPPNGPTPGSIGTASSGERAEASVSSPPRLAEARTPIGDGPRAAHPPALAEAVDAREDDALPDNAPSAPASPHGEVPRLPASLSAEAIRSPGFPQPSLPGLAGPDSSLDVPAAEALDVSVPPASTTPPGGPSATTSAGPVQAIAAAKVEAGFPLGSARSKDRSGVTTAAEPSGGAPDGIAAAQPLDGAAVAAPAAVGPAAPSHADGPAGPAHAVVVHDVRLGAVPVELGAKALGGVSRFEIRLDPVELGRIDVRLDIDKDGGVTARLLVDRPETLALLQRDARSLEQAFEQAGLKSSQGGVDLSLRDGAGQGWHGGEQRHSHPGDADGRDLPRTPAPFENGRVPRDPPGRAAGARAGIDLTI